LIVVLPSFLYSFSIGVTKEQARVLDMNGDQFVCPPCRSMIEVIVLIFTKYDFNYYLEVTSDSGIKPGRSSDESIVIKRKRIDGVSPSDRRVGERNENVTSSKNLTHSEPSKRPKTGIFFQRDSLTVNIRISSPMYKTKFLLFRNHKSIVLYMVVVIGQNPVGFIVPRLVFVVISMIHFKLFNVAKAQYVIV
jgi:hypothetical protein